MRVGEWMQSQEQSEEEQERERKERERRQREEKERRKQEDRWFRQVMAKGKKGVKRPRESDEQAPGEELPPS